MELHELIKVVQKKQKDDDMKEFADYMQINNIPIDAMYPTRPQKNNQIAFDTIAIPRFLTAKTKEELTQYSKVFSVQLYRFSFDIESNGIAQINKDIPFDSFIGLMGLIVNPLGIDSEPPAIPFANFEIQITDVSSTRNYSDEMLNLELIHGTPERPFMFPNQILFEPSTTFGIQAHDLEGSGDNNIFQILALCARYHI